MTRLKFLSAAHCSSFDGDRGERSEDESRKELNLSRAMDVVVKEGSLFLQGVKFGKRIWRKTWVILFEASAAGIGRIEMYDMREARGVASAPALRKAEKRVIRLADCLSVTPAPGESCPAECIAFYLNTAERTYTLAGPVSETWVPTLCQLAFQRTEGSTEVNRKQGASDVSMSENDLYFTWSPAHYQVTVQSSKAAVRCGMSGAYLLSPEKEALCLLDLKTGKAVFSWPYRFLRKFGLVKEGVSIEAGRRCQTGEGSFIFLSRKGPQIYRAIEEAVMHQSVQELLSKAIGLSPDSTGPEHQPRTTVEDQKNDGKDSPSSSPKMKTGPVSRRNLALPAPPSSETPTVNPRLPTISPRPAVRDPKPTVRDPRPPMNDPRPPMNDPRPPVSDPRMPVDDTRPPVCDTRPPISEPRPSCSDPLPSSSSDPKPPKNPTENLYAIIKPKPKPRSKFTATVSVQPPQVAPSSTRATLDSDDLDLDYCNWKEESRSRQDKTLYSTLAAPPPPPPPPRSKYGADTVRDSPERFQSSPVSSSSDIPVDFKRALSNLLLKDLAKNPPPFSPRTYGGSTDHLAKPDDDEMSDEDYCEIPQ